MPIYEYECARHGRFEQLASRDRAQEPEACPGCGAVSPRVVSLPRLGWMSPGLRSAMEREERSRVEPLIRRKSCGHDHGAAGRGQPRPYTGARPWVVEHG